MRFHHRFAVKAPLAAVAQFHSYSANMPNITPPPVLVDVHNAPEVLAEGDEMDFTLWLGPLPVRWLTRIQDVSETGFSDIQLRGPMLRWHHRHSYVPIDEETTEVVDDVEAELRLHPWWTPIGLAMWLNLPVLFAYRSWKTRRLLESPDPAGPSVSNVQPQAIALAAGVALLAGYAAWRIIRRLT
jgi:ligand-binding SRPBCC domain-containing protein